LKNALTANGYKLVQSADTIYHADIEEFSVDYVFGNAGEPVVADISLYIQIKSSNGDSLGKKRISKKVNNFISSIEPGVSAVKEAMQKCLNFVVAKSVKDKMLITAIKGASKTFQTDLETDLPKSPSAPESESIKAESIKKDTTPPAMLISSRGIQKEIKLSKKMIRGRASDDSEIKGIYVNGQKAQIDQKGNFQAEVLLKPGLNKIEIVAFDIYNNKTTKLFTLKRVENQEKKPDLQAYTHESDKIAPEIAITSPTISGDSPIKEKQKRIIVTGRATDKSGVVEVIVDNKEARLDENGIFSAEILLGIGENQIVVSAMDRYWNRSVKTFTILREGAVINDDEPPQKERLALIIGNANYVNAGVLRNPVNDAKSIENILKILGFDVLAYLNTSQTEMKKAIDNFGEKLKDYDIGLFFYAGHGIQVKGHNYLIPVDAKLKSENDVEYDCVDAGRVLAKMEDSDNKTNIIILDACRNNPFERSWTRSTQGQGLAFMNAPSGSLIAYATQPGNTSSDGSRRNGLYTSALLKHIKTKNITILEMFQKGRSTVMRQTGKNQIPWESMFLRGNFYFNGK